MPRLNLFLLGSPRLEVEDIETHIGRRKALALLAYLAVEPRRHSREALAAFFWPEYDASGARGRLRRTLSSLNRSLKGAYLVADRESVALDDKTDYWLDVAEFRRLVQDCENHDHRPAAARPQCQARLEQAVALYRDDFLSGFTLPDSLAFDEWSRYQNKSLRDELAVALDRLVEILRAQGNYDAAIAHARRGLSLDPLRESAHRCLMQLYALSGQVPAALRQYQACQQTLREELGVPPSAQTVDLMERIRAGGPPGSEQEAGSTVPHNLLQTTTPLVGRERELAELDELIADPGLRLITVVGPAGIGKTRLALALAERQLQNPAHAFPDGVLLVPLTRVSAADEMAPVVADSCGFRLGGAEDPRSARQQMLDYLREKRMLLVLDDFEHLLSPPPPIPPSGGETSLASFAGDARRTGEESHSVTFVADLLRTAPQVKLLVTSRERLPLRHEQAFQIRGLGYPKREPEGEREDLKDVSQYASARLFLQVAQLAQYGFELRPEDAHSLARICRLLQGMPLAIELAAAWVDALPLADIADEIERGLGFLEAEWQDAPARHRSVRAAFDASWRLLTETEQTRFAQLCVFRGGFTFEAAREVAGADLRTLARLVDKSLLGFGRNRGRYDMHELLRQYGSERLAAHPEHEQAVRDRHSAFYCSLLGRWGDAMNRGTQLDVGVDFEANWANLCAAWEWAADRGDASRLDLALDGLWHLTTTIVRYQDGDRLCRRAVDGMRKNFESRGPDEKRILAKSLILGAGFNAEMGNWDLVGPALQQGAELLDRIAVAGCDTRPEQAWLHVILGANATPDWEEARRHFDLALKLQHELGFQGQATFRVLDIAFMNLFLGKPDQAKRDVETCLAQFTAAGNHLGTLEALGMLGIIARKSKKLPEGERVYLEAAERAGALGRPASQANFLADLGTVLMMQGKYDPAEKQAQGARQIAHQCGALAVQLKATQCLAETALFRGDVGTAEHWLGKMLLLARQPMGHFHAHSAHRWLLRQPVGSFYVAMAQRWLSYCACASGDFDRAEVLVRQSLAHFGKDDPFHGIVTVGLARVVFLEGDPSSSIEVYRSGLRMLRGTSDWQDDIRALEGLSWTLAAVERNEHAVQLLGFLAAERGRTGFVLPPLDQPYHERALGVAREALGEKGFAGDWDIGAALTPEQAVEMALAWE